MLSKTMVDQTTDAVEQLQQVDSTICYIRNRNSSPADDKIWDYFKPSDRDRNRAMCLLCSEELCHNFNHDLKSTNGQIIRPRDANNNDVLWNHLKNHHCIERRAKNEVISKMFTSNGIVHKSTLANDTSFQTRRQQQNDRVLSNVATELLNSTKRKQSNSEHKDHQTMTTTNRSHHHHKHNKHKELSSTMKTSNRQDRTKLRRNLDLIDYDDIFQLRLKPVANSTNSISKNFISRLNELSSPVARKLKFWNKKSFQVNQYDPSFKVIYLGNLGMQFLSKDEQCLEKPLSTLWNNYLVYMKTEIIMRLTICNSGLKAITRQHGLTQYWSNRLVYCFTHRNYPKIFSWIYRHEGKKMRQELRCHAVFCSSPEKATKMVALLNQRLVCALQEFKREKKSREPPSIMTKCDRLNSVQLLQQTLPRTVPLRRQILAKGSANFRPPLDRSKSAPKLTSIREEDDDEDELDEDDLESNNGETSQVEFEFEESSDDRNDEDGDDGEGQNYQYYDEATLQKLVGNLNLGDFEDRESIQKNESDSLMTTVHEATSNSSSTCATGDNSFEIVSLERDQRRSSLVNDKDLAIDRRTFDRFPSPRLSRRSSQRDSLSRPMIGLASKNCSSHEPDTIELASKSDSSSQMMTQRCHKHVADGEETRHQQQQQWERQTSANNDQMHGRCSSGSGDSSMQRAVSELEAITKQQIEDDKEKGRTKSSDDSLVIR